MTVEMVRKFWHKWKQVCILVALVFLIMILLAIIVYFVATAQLKHTWHKTIYVDTRPNTTAAINLNGIMIENVTLEVTYVTDGEHTSIYAFSQPAPLSDHRSISVVKTYKDNPIYHDNVVTNKFILNKGSRMDVSFCGDVEMLVLVLETNSHVDRLTDSWVQKTVRWRKTFNGSDCRFDNETSGNFSFTSDVSSTYQFAYQPLKLFEYLTLSKVTYRGNLTQYDLKGNESYCRPSSHSFTCSITIPESSSAMVVIDVGNVSVPEDDEHTTNTLKTELRSSVLTTVTACVYSLAVFVAVVVAVVGVLILHRRKRARGVKTKQEAERLLGSDST